MIDRGALPAGWLRESIDRAIADLEEIERLQAARGFPVAPRPATAPPAPDWPVTINAAGDVAGSGAADRTAPDGRPFAPTAGAAGNGHAISGSAAPPPPAARSPGRPMVDQKVYERALGERNDLLAALARANLRAGIAEAALTALTQNDIAFMNWREIDVPAAVTAILGGHAFTTEAPLDTDDVHDLINDSKGGDMSIADAVAAFGDLAEREAAAADETPALPPPDTSLLNELVRLILLRHRAGESIEQIVGYAGAWLQHDRVIEAILTWDLPWPHVPRADELVNYHADDLAVRKHSLSAGLAALRKAQ